MHRSNHRFITIANSIPALLPSRNSPLTAQFPPAQLASFRHIDRSARNPTPCTNCTSFADAQPNRQAHRLPIGFVFTSPRSRLYAQFCTSAEAHPPSKTYELASFFTPSPAPMPCTRLHKPHSLHQIRIDNRNRIESNTESAYTADRHGQTRHS